MVAHWRRLAAGPHSLPINAVGAVATGITLVVVAVSKFAEGAWLTVVVVPLLVMAFLRVNQHYRDVAAQIVAAGPLEIAEAPRHRGRRGTIVEPPDRARPPVRRAPVARCLCRPGQVRDERNRDLTDDWDSSRRAARVRRTPVAQARRPHVAFRQFFKPLLNYVLELRDENPDATSSSSSRTGGDPLVPGAPPQQPRGHPAHAPPLRGGPRVVVVNTLFYLRG